MKDTGIVDFLKKNPKPSMSQIETLKKEDSSIIERVFELLGSLFKHSTDTDKYDPKEVEKGLRIESEHTDEPVLQDAITSAHLEEDPKYNSHLDTMEEKYSWFLLNSHTAVVRVPKYQFTGEPVQLHKIAEDIGVYGRVTAYSCETTGDITNIIYKLQR